MFADGNYTILLTFAFSDSEHFTGKVCIINGQAAEFFFPDAGGVKDFNNGTVTDT